MRILTVLTLLTLVTVAACTTAHEVKKYKEMEPLPAGTRVYIWLDGNPPGDLMTAAGDDFYRGSGPNDMIKIADFSLRKGAEISWESLLKEAKAKALEMGGNGLVIRLKSGMSVTAPRADILVFRTGPAPKK